MPTRSGTSSSSMHTTSSFTSSWLEGSPSRQSPTRNGVRTPRGSIIKDAYESPSRQIQIDFNLRLSQSDRDFNEKLDQAAAERARLHNEQLAQAAKEHERILKSAEREIERLTLEEEQERLRKEAAQQREIERLKQEKARQEAEVQRQALEAKQREEIVAQQAAENQRRIQESEARLRAQKDQAAAAAAQAKKAHEDAAQKAQEQQVAAAAAKTQALNQAQAAQVKPSPPTAATNSTATPAAASEIETLHAKYLELHARMKEFRINFQNQHKQKGDPLKEAVGDARRNVRKRLGQITVERKASVAAIAKLREEGFSKAAYLEGPTIDIRPFIISYEIPPLKNEREAQYPAFLLYIWICFEKFVLKQFEKEAANEDGRIIQEVGLIAASLFADSRYMWMGIPLTDIILAKLHRICPILFGIRGTMNTPAGRARLGWIDKQELTAGSYNQRMIGIGAGYAALSLRNFTGTNPAIPMSEYWRAIVSICNTPSEDLWTGHFSVVKGLVRDYNKKFLLFYGAQARAVLRRATIELPARAPPRCKEAAGLVSVYPDAWKKQNVNLD